MWKFWFHVDFPRFHGSNNAVCATHFYSDAVVAFGKALGFQTDFVFFPFIFGFGAIYHAGKNFSRVGGSLEQNFRGITGIYFDAGVGRADNQGIGASKSSSAICDNMKSAMICGGI